MEGVGARSHSFREADCFVACVLPFLTPSLVFFAKMVEGVKDAPGFISAETLNDLEDHKKFIVLR